MFMVIQLVPSKAKLSAYLAGRANTARSQSVCLDAKRIKATVPGQTSANAVSVGRGLVVNNVLGIQVACMEHATGRTSATVSPAGVDSFATKVSYFRKNPLFNLYIINKCFSLNSI